MIDPAVGGSDVANALSAQTVATPLDATGKSVADLLAANGFTNFTTQDLAGNKGAAPAAGSGGAESVVSAAPVAPSSAADVASASAATTGAVVAVATDQCAAQVAGEQSQDLLRPSLTVPAALSSASAAMGMTASAPTVAASNDTA